MTKLLPLALAALALAVVLAVPAHAAKSCAQVDVNLARGSEGGAVNIVASGTSCSTARAIARRFITGPCRQPGWRVTNLASGGVRFARGSAVVTFQPAGGGRCVANDYASYKPAPTRRCANAFSGADQPGIKITARAIGCAKARQQVRLQIRQGCPGDNFSGEGCETRYFDNCKVKGDRETFELYRVACYGGLERRIAWTGGS